MTLSTSLYFHDGLWEDDYQFGKLDVSIEDSEMPNNTWDVKFSIDRSGSMSDTCKDLKTKMQHIQHTMSNILRMFSECETCKFNVSVDAFDDKYDLIFDFQEINSNTVDEFIEKIRKIYPRNSTNLILPIQKTQTEMQNRKNMFPENKQLHVLLTDGCDTFNKNIYDDLNQLTSPECDFIAFGFGIQHDAKALTIMGEKNNSDYGFIDELEQAGFVYGEYLHAVLHKLFTNIQIDIEDGEIYNWKTNTWADSLLIPSLDSGASKSYYVRTKNKDATSGFVSAYVLSKETQEILDDFETVPDLLVVEDDGTEHIDPVVLTRDIYRYRTLVLMAEIKNNSTSDSHENKKIMKKKIRDFFEEMKDYISTNDLQNDLFMKKLQDDVYVMYKTYDTPFFEMYSAARQRSQGNENICTATQLDDISTVPYDKLRRSHAIHFDDDVDVDVVDDLGDDLGDDLDYNISNVVDTEATRSMSSVSRMMRSISKK
jgi:von Willebrand factor type A domain